MADINKADVVNYLEKASMIEISELIKEIEEKFDIQAAGTSLASAAGKKVRLTSSAAGIT